MAMNTMIAPLSTLTAPTSDQRRCLSLLTGEEIVPRLENRGVNQENFS